MTDTVAQPAPIDLNLLGPFLLVCDTGSFAKAAQRLGVKRSSVSRAVAALEASVGAQLFVRTTRQVTPTSAGVALQAKTAPQYAALQAALRTLPEGEAAPSGLLRLTTAHDVGTEMLARALPGFAARYPAVQLDVRLTSRAVDLAAEGFDVALRIGMGQLQDTRLVAKPLTTLALQLFASPQYLARQPVPNREALRAHTLVSLPNMHARMTADLAPYFQEVRVVADDPMFIRNAVRHGLGLAIMPTFLAQDDVEAGLLVRVLPRVFLTLGTLFFAHPYGARPPRKVTALRAYLVDYLAAHPLAGAAPQGD